MMKGEVFIESYAYLANDRLPEMNGDDAWQIGPILVKCGASIRAGGELIEGLRARRIGSRVYYPLLVHQQPLCRSLSYDDQLPMVEHDCQQVFSLPAHPGVGPDD
jgi:dTDP-4-amino-4,6-dideoxygalactose transaminase